MNPEALDAARKAGHIRMSLEGMYEPDARICGLNSMYTPPDATVWLEHASQWPLIAASREWPARWRLAAQQCLDGADPRTVLAFKAWYPITLFTGEASGAGMTKM